MDTHFLKLLVCPLCNSPLRHDQSEHELICQYDQLAYPIRNGIPIMLQEEARSLRQNQDAAAPPPLRPAADSSSGSASEPAGDQTDSNRAASSRPEPGNADPAAPSDPRQ